MTELKTQHVYKAALIILGITIAYVALLLLLGKYFQSHVGILGIFPAIAFGMLYGMAAGIITGIVIVPLNILFYWLFSIKCSGGYA